MNGRHRIDEMPPATAYRPIETAAPALAQRSAEAVAAEDPYDDAPALTADAGGHEYSAGADGTLGRSAARGATATIGGQAIRVMLQAASLVVLARLLAPSDYGLIAEIIAIVGIGEVIRDFGLSSAAMQATKITVGQRNNLFWTNTCIGSVLGVAAFFLAPALAALYSDPKLIEPARIIAVTFLLNGMAAQLQADLNRKLLYGKVIVADVGSQLLAFGLAVSLALNGAGYWALVAQQVGQAAAALLIVFVLNDWRPGPPDRTAPMKSFWTYGWGLMGTQMLGYATRNIDTVVIGYRFGAGQLGFYERAFQVLMLPLNQINAPITRVALPVLARLQHSPDEFRAFLFRGQTVLTNATVAVFSFGAALAAPLFDLIFGSRWSAAVPLFQILAVGGMFQAASYPAYWAFLAKGLTKTNLLSALVSRPLMAVGIVVGSNWGTTGVAVGYAIGLFVVWPVEMWFIHRSTEVNGWSLFQRGLKPLLCWLTVAAVPYLALRWFGWTGLPAIGYATVAFALAALTLYAMFPPFRRDLQTVLATMRLMRGPTVVTQR